MGQFAPVVVATLYWRKATGTAALAGLVLLVMASLFAMEGDLRSRRLGPGARAIVILWLLSGLVAAILDRTGVF